MIEDFIEEHSGEYKRKALSQALPRGVMYPTFKRALDYLLESGKVLIDSEGYVVWIHNPEYVRKMLAEPHLRLA